MIWAVVVAAGRSARMGGADKLMLPLLGKPVLRWCLEAYDACDAVDAICLVTAQDRLDACKDLAKRWNIAKLKAVVIGGNARTVSVYNGLKALPQDCEIVAIQDGARPFTTPDVIKRSILSARLKGSGVAAIACRDTVKAAADDGLVLYTPDRSTLKLVQTPQTFQYKLILQAYEKAMYENATATDDAAIAELTGEKVYLTEGSAENIKITTPEDAAHGEAILRARGFAAMDMRIGEGYDVHQLVPGRKLTLGGVEIPHETGLLGHSDADVLVHSIMDALLGAAGLGDIGRHFPDNDEAYKGISSLLLLKKVAALLAEKGWKAGNVDATVVAQRPKIASYIPNMRENIADCLSIPQEQVNVKATTTEKLGFEGREEGISAKAVAIITR